MLRQLFPLVLTLLIFTQVQFAIGQEAWQVKEIIIRGHQHTKEFIIKREIPLAEGDTILNWPAFKEECRDLLLNTGLFSSVELSRKVGQHKLIVDVKETLFILPIPFIDLADRNFNEWWVTHNHEFRRLNFGLDLYHINLTGRNDLFKISGQLGLIRKFNLEYNFPFFGEGLTVQPYIEFLYANQNEVPYTTEENKQVWHRNEDQLLLERYRLSTGIRYRPNYRTSYTLEATYFHRKAGQDVVEMNPFFFSDGRQVQEFAQLRLVYDAEFRNRPVYPTDGYKIKLDMVGNGLSKDLQTVYFETEFAYWESLSAKWSAGMNIFARKYIYQEELPFYNARGIGYKNQYVRSYEYFVVDGPDFLLARANVKWNILDVNFNWGKIMFVKPLQKMPVQLFINFFSDAARVNSWREREDNFLDDDWLVGYGMGIDVLCYENFLFQVQYSRGIHDNDGIFLHFSTNY